MINVFYCCLLHFYFVYPILIYLFDAVRRIFHQSAQWRYVYDWSTLIQYWNSNRRGGYRMMCCCQAYFRRLEAGPLKGTFNWYKTVRGCRTTLRIHNGPIGAGVKKLPLIHHHHYHLTNFIIGYIIELNDSN